MDERMETFYRELAQKNMDALWRGRPPARPNSGMQAPYPPCHWAWSDIRPFMDRASELVATGPDAERRVVQLINPALTALRSASHTLTANVQMVLPGEIAPSHRHTTAAIRFIIEGASTVTIVNGEAVEMRPGDLVLTPGGYWHGHINESDGPMLWMDTLDRPIVSALRQVYQEPYETTLQPITKQKDESFARYGTGHLRAAGTQAERISPLFLYRWSQTEAALDRLARISADPFDDVAFDYVNPTTGGHVLPTIGCRIQLIRAGVETKSHRHSSVSVFHVFRGAGSTVVDGVQIDWKQGDFLVVPPYAWHDHRNLHGEDAVLFSTTDTPVLEALNLLREEAYPDNGGRQPITAGYVDQKAAMHAGAA
jgi:gentisate 1,2-dioxygenase